MGRPLPGSKVRACTPHAHSSPSTLDVAVDQAMDRRPGYARIMPKPCRAETQCWLYVALECVQGCVVPVALSTGLTPKHLLLHVCRRAENGGSPDGIMRAKVSSLCMRAFQAMHAEARHAARVPTVSHCIANGEGEAQAAALCREHNWAFVDQDSDSFVLVDPTQSVCD